MKRIGLLGGSFDPIHLGHIWIATFAREDLDLERVLLIPAATPPHKGGGTVAPYSLRLDLIRRAVASHPGLSASDLEADPLRPSFTVETLRRLRAGLDPEDEIWLLMGSDSLNDLPAWREPDQIMALAHLGVYGRPGEDAVAPRGARARWIEGPACGLSSTLIRERLLKGRSIAAMVPAEIVSLLESSAFYRGTPRDG